MNAAASPPASKRGRAVAPWGWPLVALRLALMATALLICAPLYYLLAPLVDRNPVPRWFLRTLTLIAGIDVRTVGAHPAPRTFFLANHVSLLDFLAIAGVTGSAFIAHDGLAAFGPLRWLCSLNDTVFVARHDRRSVSAQVERVRSALRETGALTIFPEGTTSDGTTMLPFKSSLLSALDTGAEHIPIQPVWLDYGKDTREIAWIGDEPGLENALRILARWRAIELTINFLPPLATSERADRKAIARTAQDAINAAMAANRGLG